MSCLYVYEPQFFSGAVLNTLNLGVIAKEVRAFLFPAKVRSK